MLIIGGSTITNLDAIEIRRAFGYSYQRNERVADLIDDYILNGYHSFKNSADFKRQILRALSGPHLSLAMLHPQFPGPYRIQMQGSRQADFAEANRLAGLHNTPTDYTWHHREGIVCYSAGNYWCDMYLVQTRYHASVRHTGGVREYELATGQSYRA